MSISAPTDGTIAHIADLYGRGDSIDQRLSAMNSRTCWTPELHDTLWGMVNDHIWRRKAMYEGGDCALAGWPGAVPGQRLYPHKHLIGGVGYVTLPGYRGSDHCLNGQENKP